MVETKILEMMPDVHFVMNSRQNEVDYLRQLADHTVGLVADESRIAGRSVDDDSPFHDTVTNRSVINHSLFRYVFTESCEVGFCFVFVS